MLRGTLRSGSAVLGGRIRTGPLPPDRIPQFRHRILSPTNPLGRPPVLHSWVGGWDPAAVSPRRRLRNRKLRLLQKRLVLWDGPADLVPSSPTSFILQECAPGSPRRHPDLPKRPSGALLRGTGGGGEGSQTSSIRCQTAAGRNGLSFK